MNFRNKKNYRWIFRVEGIETYLLSSFKFPKIEPKRYFGIETPDNINPIFIEIIDAVNPSGSKQVMNWIDNNVSKDGELILLDHESSVIEKWIFKDLYIMSADFGTLDYLDISDRIIKCELNFSSYQFIDLTNKEDLSDKEEEIVLI